MAVDCAKPVELLEATRDRIAHVLTARDPQNGRGSWENEPVLAEAEQDFQ